MLKSDLRQAAIAARAGFDPLAGEALAQVVLASLQLDPYPIIAGVWPMPGEMDLRPLLRALHARGHTIVLPETTPRGQALLFRLWAPGCTMVRERFGTLRPDGPVMEPDLLFVPLLAFDRAGGRLGYGGGYYDRTLAAAPGRAAIGFGYAAQEVDRVPMEAHDQTLATIVTERDVIRTAAA